MLSFNVLDKEEENPSQTPKMREYYRNKQLYRQYREEEEKIVAHEEILAQKESQLQTEFKYKIVTLEAHFSLSYYKVHRRDY